MTTLGVFNQYLAMAKFAFAPVLATLRIKLFGGLNTVLFSDDINLGGLDLRSLYLSIKEKLTAGQKCRQ